MFEGDISLDNEGNVLLKDGDIRLTDSDEEFFRNMLITTPGSWKFEPTLGVGLEKFIGEQQNEYIHSQIAKRIKSFFELFFYHTDVIVYKIENGVSGVNIRFQTSDLKTYDISFSFNLASGSIKFLTKESGSATQIVTNIVKNKYLRRS